MVSKKKCVLDTTISDYNIGNQIIMESVNQLVDELFRDFFIYRLQYAEKFGKQSLCYMKESDCTIFGGTNSLSSQMNRYKQMGFRLSDLRYVNNLVLLGLGWWQYQSKPNLYTRILLKGLLSKRYLHSVRDGYTKSMLAKIGIKNVLNTGCPTTWKLTKQHCQAIPVKKAENVVMTLTDYNKNPNYDKALIDMLAKCYKTVYFWIQGIGDLEYLKKLQVHDHRNIKVINPKLVDYDKLLQSEHVDYIGTRLHAGIRALQCGKRTMIISIDNRAIEISQDIGLPILSREKISIELKSFIYSDYYTDIDIPRNDIIRWKNQFNHETL